SQLHYTPVATDGSDEANPVWSPDGRSIVYAAEVNGVYQIMTRSPSSSTPAKITASATHSQEPFWSPDGSRIFYLSAANKVSSLWSIGAAGGSPEVVVESVSRAAISPDGNALALLRPEQG